MTCSAENKILFREKNIKLPYTKTYILTYKCIVEAYIRKK